MKRPLQLSLAIALALGVSDAFALGLGAIEVRSGLNQPLSAEIPIIQSAPGEAEGLIVQLASAEDFERVGLNRSSIGVPVEFALGKNARGEPVIKITSKEVVREPFLGFLVEANWPKGRLLREYTVLLDPPIMAPAVKGSSAVAVVAQEPERAATHSLPDSRPAPASAPTTRPAAPAKPVVAARAEPKLAAPRAAAGNDYGPVASGETLGEIARATRPGSEVSVNQMMLALLKSNPNAFFKDNINALKRGAVLRIPSADEIAANGSAREAAAAVRSQISEWRGGAGRTPTLVADTGRAPTGSSKAGASASSASAGERLALVPPREGKAGQNAVDRPGGGSAGGSGDVATKAELARVKEALTSREQESGELKSRVKDLEEIKGKNDKLINLQNTELAELRNKLKALQDQANKPAAKPVVAATVAPATTPPVGAAAAAVADAKITKDDIWGDGDKAAGKATASSPAATNGSATPPATPAPQIEPAAHAAAPTTDVASPPASASDTAATTPPAASAVEPVKVEPAAPKVAEVKKDAKKPVAPVTSRPGSPASPWYLEPWALGGAGIGGLLLVLLGISGLRKRKPVTTASRASIADSFDDSPLTDGSATPSVSDVEEELIDQVRRDPGNAGAHLELLSLYYSQRASGKFEAAAEEMYAYIADPNQPEWREARSMGEELVPHNPLFGNQGSIVDDFAGERAGHEYSFEEPVVAEAPSYGEYRFDEPAFEKSDSTLTTATMPAEDFDFDLGDERPHAPAVQAPADTSFSFDLPPLEPIADPPLVTEFDIEPESESPPALADDEFFASEDAIGTKLDLAKAYLDMGDPEGARSMLEEVLIEGAPQQQAEARKLIAEIR